jgi:hypothetical protein
MKIDPESRRSFVKKSLASSMTVTFAGLIRAHGNGSNGETTIDPENTYVTTNSGTTTTFDLEETIASTGAIRKKTETQYRLICVRSPQTRTGQIAWLEASRLEDISNAKAHVIKVEAISSPHRGQTDFGVMRITASWTSTLTKHVQKCVEKHLKYKLRNYNGEWIKEGEPAPVLKVEIHLDSEFDLPITMPSLSFNLAADQIDASVIRSGFFIDGFSVTGGNNIVNSTEYVSSQGVVSVSESGAELSLGVPNVAAGAEAGLKSVTTNTKIENKSGFNIKTGGITRRTREYVATVSENGNTNFSFSGECSSSLNATIAMDWKIIVQTRNRIVVYNDGSEPYVEQNSETQWEPEMKDEDDED